MNAEAVGLRKMAANLLETIRQSSDTPQRRECLNLALLCHQTALEIELRGDEQDDDNNRSQPHLRELEEVF
jgi:hypothetical protein